MAHYLVYVPSEHVRAASEAGRHPLEHVGLADHFPDAMGVQIGDGPDRKGGQLYGWIVPTAPHRLKFVSDEQTWIPAVPDPQTEAAAQRYWVGFWNDSPVTARDLVRSQTVPGTELQIDGTGHWSVPHPSQLPFTLGLGSAGHWVERVDEQYREYHSTVKTVQNTIAAGNIDFENCRLWDFCLTALQINYRLTREAVSHMNLFTSVSTVKIARLAIGLSEEGLR